MDDTTLAGTAAGTLLPIIEHPHDACTGPQAALIQEGRARGLAGATVKFVNEVLRIGEVGDLELQPLVRGTVEGRAKVCGPATAEGVGDELGLLLRL